MKPPSDQDDLESEKSVSREFWEELVYRNLQDENFITLCEFYMPAIYKVAFTYLQEEELVRTVLNELLSKVNDINNRVSTATEFRVEFLTEAKNLILHYLKIKAAEELRKHARGLKDDEKIKNPERHSG